MNEINQRIRQIFSAIGITQTEFAKRISVSPAYIWKLLNKNNAIPSDRTISDICREFNVSEVWLRTGEGTDMFITLDEDAEFNLICEEIQFSGDDFIKQIIRNYWKLDEKEKTVIRKMMSGLS